MGWLGHPQIHGTPSAILDALSAPVSELRLQRRAVRLRRLANQRMAFRTSLRRTATPLKRRAKGTMLSTSRSTKQRLRSYVWLFG